MGNRMDVRVRGNASQLLEKYRQLARDASQAGDRVAAEYYLQFADHYYRVLAEFRDRQEQQRPQQQQRQRDDYFEDGDDGDEGQGPEPLRVSEMTVMHQSPRPDTAPAAEADEGGDDREIEEPVEASVQGEADGGDDAPRRRRRRSRGPRRDEGADAGEMETVDA